MKTINSVVPGFEGECVPVWVNRSMIDNRIDGGATGFFKKVERFTLMGIPYTKKIGVEFHGIIMNGEVHPH